VRERDFFKERLTETELRDLLKGTKAAEAFAWRSPRAKSAGLDPDNPPPAECYGQPVKIGEIHENELRRADEVWMTSSTKEILAITTLDGQPVGTGTPGPLGKQMWQWYQDFKNTVMRKG